MQRYQIYLDPRTVTILDDAESISNISRSQLIRMAAEAVSENLAKILAVVKPANNNYTHLDNLAGFIKPKTKQPTSYATRSDRDYL